MSDPTLSADIAAMSFEDALAELEQIVRRLEAGQVKLDEAIQSYERGAQLKRHCELKLTSSPPRKRGSGATAGASALDSRLRGNDG